MRLIVLESFVDKTFPIASYALFASSEIENCSLPSGVPERLMAKVYILPFLVNAEGATEDSDAVPPTNEN